MIQLTRESVQKLCQQSQIHCTREEEILLLEDLIKMRNYIEFLQAVDTRAIEPCTHISKGVLSFFREDTVGFVMAEEEFLSNVPCHKLGMVCVPPILK